MSPELGPGSRSEANKPATPSPWLLLYEVQVSTIERLYLVNNEQPFTFEGNVYRPFPVTLEQIEETLAGDIPGMNLVVSNITLEFQALLSHRRGLIDRPVLVRVVHKDWPEEPAIVHRFTIRSVEAGGTQATFFLSQLPFMEIDLPYQTFQRDSCRHTYRSAQCGFAHPTLPPGVADLATCSKRRLGPNGCEAHGQAYIAAGLAPLHPKRFGAAPSIPRRRS